MSSSEKNTVLDAEVLRASCAPGLAQRIVRHSMLVFVLSLTAFFAVSLVFYLKGRLAHVQVGPLVGSLIFFKAAVEIWCSIYAGYFIFISLYYLATCGKANQSRKQPTGQQTPALAIIYLCCDDLDPECLESLCCTRANGPFKVIVHDDSREIAEQQRVDDTVQALSQHHEVDIEVLRRGNREGGKPGALNFVLARIPEAFEWMLICDNDSLARDRDWYLHVSAELCDPKLAVVQFRNVGEVQENAGAFHRQLGRSIDVFEVFVSPAEKFGWLPFFGHNGILRIKAVREVGGFQPGEFADDIDMSIRLNLAGYRISYRQDIAFSEAHPDNYRAFRARSYKWAYGCASVLRRWGWKILKSRTLKAYQKLFFFVFIGFYYTQIILLSYLFVAYLLLPFLIPGYQFSPVLSILGGSLVVFLMYLPTLAYHLGNGMLHKWPGFAVTVGLVYGSIDFVSARALIDCALKRRRSWIPTNTVRSSLSVPWFSWLESSMGFCLLAVPYVLLPHLLYLPCSYLFALKFLAIPGLHLGYGKPHLQLAGQPSSGLKQTDPEQENKR